MTALTVMADVIVVGAGLAGMTAALSATRLGASVRVLEQSQDDIYPCNTRYSGGLFHIALDNILGDPATVRANIDRATQGAAVPELGDALVANAPRAIGLLKELGVRFIATGHEGLRRNSLAPPIVRRPGLHWRGRAGDVMFRTLEAALLRRGGVIERGVQATQLIMDEAGQRCVGVRAVRDSVETEYRAGAVILADGGFQANHDLLREYITAQPQALLQRNARSGRGSGVQMARQAGARLIGVDRFYGHVQHRKALQDERLWPYPVVDALATVGVVVDASGRRFCDEGHGGVHIANAIARLPDPLSAFVIFDQSIWETAGRSGLLPVNPHLVAAGGDFISAPTLEDLAAKIGVPQTALQTSVMAHNRLLSEGRTTQGEPVRTLSRHAAAPIHGAPFHAMPVCAGITYTMGGVLIDSRARVVHESGRFIPGLYAAGATTGGLEGGPQTGYTGGLSKAATFGLVAGETAAHALRQG